MAETISRKLRVFLCHSSIDKALVRELYKKLNAEGWIDPWLDEEKLLPGQLWFDEIERAVESADAVIVCLSSKSVSKEGNLQTELKYALNIALEKPLYTSFLVPLRFDDCDIPRNLRTSAYVDFFPRENYDFAYNLLSRSLAIRAKELGVDVLKADIEQDGIDLVSAETLVQQEIPRVFISYSREDINFVENLAVDLQTVGLDVWWDIFGVRGGDNWVRSIQDALDKSKYCIVVITPNSMNSIWVEKEYTYAMNNHKVVIPLFLVDCKLPFSFSTTHYVDFRETRYRTALRELYSALGIKVGGK